jgi:hypothetical protein
LTWVLYLQLIILSVRDDVPIDSETLVTDFINLKIKPVQSFRVAYRNMMYMYVFIGVIAYKYLRLSCVSKKILRKAFT